MRRVRRPPDDFGRGRLGNRTAAFTEPRNTNGLETGRFDGWLQTRPATEAIEIHLYRWVAAHSKHSQEPTEVG